MVDVTRSLFDDDPLRDCCVSCRSSDTTPIGRDMRKCNACGAAMQRDARTGEFVRMATLYTGKRLRRPSRKQTDRWLHR